MPKVSIILTSFNHEDYIREAIDSVLNQTFKDFELIIWDDASSDDSWNIINSYTDPRIRTFRNDKTRRGIYGINRAITEVASGEYIAIHHSDDIWEPGKLEKQVTLLDRNSQAGGVFTHVQIINEHNEELDNDWFNVPNKSRHEQLRGLFENNNRLCHPSALIRRSIYASVGLYRYGLAQTADADMWIRLLKVSDIYLVQEKLIRHRLFNDKSNTSGDKPHVRSRLNIEWNLLKLNYLDLTKDDLIAMFPESARWVGRKDSDAKFILAMIAIELNSSLGTKLFGFNLLFSLISDPDSVQRIVEQHNYDYLDYIELTAKYDIIPEGVYSERQRLQDEIDSFHRSIVWRVREPLRRAYRLIGAIGRK